MICFKLRLLLIILQTSFGVAKSQSTDECKYVTVIAYLKTHAAINDQIKAMYAKRKLTSYKNKIVEFNLSNQVAFIGIYDFREKLKNKNIGIDTALIFDYNSYRKQYYFESYRSEYLMQLMEPNDSKLFLTFSKPVGNFLVIEVGTTNPENYSIRQFGLGMTILFTFNSSGLVDEVFYAAAAYN